MGIKCCKGCEKRHEDCHATCEIYKAEKAEYEKEKQWLKDKNGKYLGRKGRKVGCDVVLHIHNKRVKF